MSTPTAPARPASARRADRPAGLRWWVYAILATAFLVGALAGASICALIW